MPEPEYLQAIGEVVYNFSRVEWNVIWIIARIVPHYFDTMPDKKVPSRILKDLRAAVVAQAGNLDAQTKDALATADRLFDHLTKRRNYLLHSHPFTAADGTQRLGKTEERLWTLEKIRALNEELQDADRQTNGLVHSEVLKTIAAALP